MILAKGWKDYELLDMNNGEKLERFGRIITIRPDPQIVWCQPNLHKSWSDCNMHYHRSKSGGGNWEIKKDIPNKWTISFNNLKFNIRPTDFKHMGIFPEQSVNWQWIINKISNAKRPIRALNLFAYTGGATLACAYAGANVCHVDSSKGMNQWAKDNLALSALADNHVRFIADDVMKFVQREKRRKSYYDAIIMDPPSYGRGPSGEVWKFENNINNLIEACIDIFSDNPLFFLINSYTTGFSHIVLENILKIQCSTRFGGIVSSGELGIPSSTGFALPCGIYGRWEN